MTQSNYKMIFSVEVQHTYFENDICNCLQFNPSDTTMAILKRFGFRMNNKIDGFEFYSDTTTALPAFLNYITATTGQDNFDFDIATTNPEFNNFTDLPTDWIAKMIFDSQSSSNEYNGGIVSLAKNLSPNQNASTVGNLKIHFEDIVKYGNENGYAVFEIQLNARSTQWQYFIINKSSLQLENLSIGGKAEVKFEGPENVVIQSGQQALLFSSGDKLLPLSEIPKYKFDLVNNPKSGSESPTKKSNSKIIFKGLPNPDPKHFGIIGIGNQNQVSSPMYVFV